MVLETQNNVEHNKAQNAFFKPYLILLKYFIDLIEVTFAGIKCDDIALEMEKDGQNTAVYRCVKA